nr:MAG TPA: hypothetical protein [Caudoviricetes sp.]
MENFHVELLILIISVATENILCTHNIRIFSENCQ